MREIGKLENRSIYSGIYETFFSSVIEVQLTKIVCIYGICGILIHAYIVK